MYPRSLRAALALTFALALSFALVLLVSCRPDRSEPPSESTASTAEQVDSQPDAHQPDAHQPDAHQPDDLDARIEAMIERADADGLVVAVVRGQDVLLARGYGTREEDGAPYTADTVLGLFSATKALSSFVVASLVEDGRLDLEAPLGELLDDAPAAWRTIPFWRLLNHTSGITTIVDRPEFEALAADPTSSNRDVYDIVRALPLDYAPGAASRYRQSGYAVAEMIVAERTGATWPELVAEHVTRPAGMTATAHQHLASGERTTPLLTSAGFYQTTAHDLARLFQALNDGRIVDPAFLERLLFTEAYVFRDADSEAADAGYSLGSILDVVDGVRTLGHQGGGARATIRYAPSRRVGVAVLTADTSTNDVALEVADLLLRAALGSAEP